MTGSTPTVPQDFSIQVAENEGMPTVAQKAAREGRARDLHPTGNTAPRAASPKAPAQHKEKT
jgi:hypothetical protein